jgi:hypothetical protein
VYERFFAAVAVLTCCVHFAAAVIYISSEHFATVVMNILLLCVIFYGVD